MKESKGKELGSDEIKLINTCFFGNSGDTVLGNFGDDT